MGQESIKKVFEKLKEVAESYNKYHNGIWLGEMEGIEETLNILNIKAYSQFDENMDKVIFIRVGEYETKL